MVFINSSWGFLQTDLLTLQLLFSVPFGDKKFVIDWNIGFFQIQEIFYQSLAHLYSL